MFSFLSSKSYNFFIIITIEVGYIMIFYKINIEKPYYNYKVQRIMNMEGSLILWSGSMLCVGSVTEGNLVEGNIVIFVLGVVLIIVREWVVRDSRLRMLSVHESSLNNSSEVLEQINFIMIIW